MKVLEMPCFAVNKFVAHIHQQDECGANGLPLTPSSVKILGRFQFLKTFRNPYLCQYIDVQRCKHERVIVVSEYFSDSLKRKKIIGLEEFEFLRKMSHEILLGLLYLAGQGVVHRCLSPQNILFDSKSQVKLFNYGMYYMTGYGADISFPLGHIRYLAPEVLLTELHWTQTRVPAAEDFGCGPGTISPLSSTTDVWSLAIIVLELFLGCSLWDSYTVKQIATIINSFVSQSGSPLDVILEQHNAQETFDKIPADFQQFIRQCLNVDRSKRPSPAELLSLPLFEGLSAQPAPVDLYIFSPNLRCEHLELPTQDSISEQLLELPSQERISELMLAERSLVEIYSLWQLAGGDLEVVLKKAGMMRAAPAVSRLANFVLQTGDLYGEVKDGSSLRDDRVTVLPMEQLIQRLSHIDPLAYWPLMEEEFQPVSATDTDNHPKSPGGGSQNHGLPNALELAETSRLPLVIKERDVEYQLHRMILFERMLRAYPYLRPRILKEARVDIPPLYRPLVWAAILDVKGDVRGRYDSIDKESPTVSDRQIEVDIPRCHQYNEILSSPQGHRKLKRILKAWVKSHPEYVYWQGLDSLCAPFLCLNFNDEAVAFACMETFIPKYLNKFFLKDNSKVIQEYLAVFGHIIAFHEPELFSHLDGIDFIPDLYAIPWFLTMFAHVFPMHKIYHLWDTLLHGNSSYPLFIGVAILYQFKDQLLTFGFNECILHFSDMPEIDIEKCVGDSIRLFCCTPKSATYRQHALPVQTTRVRKTSHTDYSHLEMEAIPLEQLKCEKCCRISAADLLDMKGLLIPNGETGSYNKSKSGKSKVTVIDIRSRDEFQRGAIPDSLSIPFETAFSTDGHLNPSTVVDSLSVQRSLVKVIVSNRDHQAVKFAENLLSLGYSKVCILHKGIDPLRTIGVLIVPTPEL